MAFPDSFSTERLRAERLVPEHLPALRHIHSDPVLMATLGGVRDEAGTGAYLERNLRHWGEYGFGIWVLREPTDGRVAGLGVLRHLALEGADEIEVGYGLYPEFWGRGLATEIAAECIRLGRERLGVSSVVGLTLASNLRSQRVLAKVGLRYDRDVIHEGVPQALFRSA